jgi:hypothetical protein
MTRLLTRIILLGALSAGLAVSGGCASDSYATQGATKGAGTGAMAGAVGAAATALIFGGNIGEAAARGAVYGGASGAVVGGVSGAEADRRVAEQEQAEYERRVAQFREEIGTDAFNGFVALAECKYEIAIANAREAQGSRNSDFSLAGYWVEALVESERGDLVASSELLPTLVERDRELANIDAASERLAEALNQLGNIREQNDLPRTCG